MNILYKALRERHIKGLSPLNLRLIKFASSIVAVLILAACSGGTSVERGDNAGAAFTTLVPETSINPDTVSSGAGDAGDPSGGEIVGTVTFDRVPYADESVASGLDYTRISAQIARNITVELLDANSASLAVTKTGNDGRYRFFNVPAQTQVRVRALAAMRGESPVYDISVRDNTRNNALYAIRGSLIDSTEFPSRNLNARSGWDASAREYDNSLRQSGPFAILDTTLKTLEAIDYFNRALDFSSPVQFRWSSQNRPAAGNLNEGEISSTFFDVFSNSIYILGQANVDTDEFDESVISHEIAHLFEDNFSRSDSFGGDHSALDRLDMRVAYSEGFGNAFSAKVLNNTSYIDTRAADQSQNFQFDVTERVRPTDRQGWFNESSVHRFLYAYINDDASFTNYLDLILSDEFTNSPSLISVFTAAALMKSSDLGQAARIDESAIDNGFVANDIWGEGETNNGGVPESLPVYTDAPLDQTVRTICTSDDAGFFNKLANRSFARVFVNEASEYDIRVLALDTGSDPDLFIYQNGFIGEPAQQSSDDLELVRDVTLTRGYAVVDITEYNNLAVERSSGDYCYEITITQ